MLAKKHVQFIIFAVVLISIATSLVKKKRFSTKEEARSNYVLILSAETPETAPWIKAFRKTSTSTYVLSGYPDETAKGLMKRLPWLLQPGVDTLIYDPALAGWEVADSLKKYLQNYAPATVMLIRKDASFEPIPNRK